MLSFKKKILTKLSVVLHYETSIEFPVEIKITAVAVIRLSRVKCIITVRVPSYFFPMFVNEVKRHKCIRERSNYLYHSDFFWEGLLKRVHINPGGWIRFWQAE